VPATFTANRAKCRECGGIVEIAPFGEAAPKAAPVKVATPPSQAVETPQAPVAAPAPARPVAHAPSESERVAVPAKPDAPRAAAPAKSESVRSAAEAAAKRVKSSPASSKSAHGHADHAHAGARHHHAPKKSNTGLIIGIVVGVVAVFGAGAYLLSGDKKEAPKVAEVVAQVDPAYDLSTFPEQTRPPGYAKAEWDDIRPTAENYWQRAPGSEAEKMMLTNLTGRPKGALPQLLNALRALNLSKSADFDKAEAYVRAFAATCGGRDFGWKKKGDTPEFLAADLAVVAKLFDTYKRMSEDAAVWTEMIAPAGTELSTPAPGFDQR
jgi:hypothetical protein